MKKDIDRKSFLKSMAAGGFGLSLGGSRAFYPGRQQDPIPVGMIGLDTSHSPAFTRYINNPEGSESTGFKVVAAYPHGSRKIESSYSRIPRYTKAVKEMGVEIVDSIDELIERVDYILLETNDGHPHLEQAMPALIAGKPMFIDKPVAGSLRDAVAIFEASKRYDTPVFSSSSLRYINNAQAVRYQNKIGKVVGADAYSSAGREPSHPDLFWYGIHGVEIIFTVMGTGCKSVTRTETDKTDIVVGTWNDGRAATFRGIRDGEGGIGGIAFGTEEILTLGPSHGYRPLVEEILKFFRTGNPPVSMDETLEIYAFMEAADESKRRGGEPVTLDYVLSKARS